MCKKGDCWLTKHTKEECDEVREGFKRRVHQYLVDNDIDDDFNKDIVLTTTSGNFFYDDYGVKHFITLNRLILIKTAKNIVTFINNNAFIYGLTGNIEPSGMELGGTESENLTLNIDFLDCYFDDDRQDYGYLVINPSTYFPSLFL